jgi:uncharacterized membrane protein
LIRVWFVQRHKNATDPLVLSAGLVLLAITALLALPRPVELGGGPVAFDQIQPIIQAKCVPCHATKPTQEGIAAPPKGVILEMPSQIRAMAAAINQQAVVSRVMPPGNMTHISDSERQMIARWFAGGAE